MNHTSLVASFMGLLIPAPYIGLLGLFPIYLGVKTFWNYRNKAEHTELNPGVEKEIRQQGNVLAVAEITFANGGDNIAVYVPLFTTLTWPHKLTMIGIFFVMT